MIPGEVRVSTEPLEFGTDAEKITMVVVNDGDLDQLVARVDGDQLQAFGLDPIRCPRAADQATEADAEAQLAGFEQRLAGGVEQGGDGVGVVVGHGKGWQTVNIRHPAGAGKSRHAGCGQRPAFSQHDQRLQPDQILRLCRSRDGG